MFARGSDKNRAMGVKQRGDEVLDLELGKRKGREGTRTRKHKQRNGREYTSNKNIEHTKNGELHIITQCRSGAPIQFKKNKKESHTVFVFATHTSGGVHVNQEQ